ncbi:hypothetical protein TcasGA2_TC001337 [Tribolium castaneum]|uniref:Uncharacterized protein n=1 Tax=Tribolium castaneum TaxID=7070 RepID=D6WC77_TRICA|nr:hypothetical protein TcasGA2_TC001337 [Tribolium castaneum]
MEKQLINQKNLEIIDTKSLSELKDEHFRLSRELEEREIRFVQLSQREEILKKQELLLKKQAHDLNESITSKHVALENVQRQTEEIVKEFITQVNTALDKNKHMFETKEETAERKRKMRKEREERRQTYLKLKGEVGALLLFKEYQECVIAELERVEAPYN